MHIYYVLPNFYVIKTKLSNHTLHLLSQTHFAMSHGIKISKYIIFFFLVSSGVSGLYVGFLRYRGTID